VLIEYIWARDIRKIRGRWAKHLPDAGTLFSLLSCTGRPAKFDSSSLATLTSRLWLRVDRRSSGWLDDVTGRVVLGGETGVFRLLVDRAALGGAMVGSSA
jgi:hypothetical protein